VELLEVAVRELLRFLYSLASSSVSRRDFENALQPCLSMKLFLAWDYSVVGYLDGRIEKLSAARLRRRAIRVHNDLFVPMVRRLQHRARLDVDDSAGRDIHALRWVAEIHRQRPG
jgi:hypothetical protein